jgi:hypothetical protein
MSDKLARIAALVKESRTTSNAFRIRQIGASKPLKWTLFLIIWCIARPATIIVDIVLDSDVTVALK